MYQVRSGIIPTDANLVTTDITTNNVSTTKHGFAPKATGTATQYLDGTGISYTTPGGSVTTQTTTATGPTATINLTGYPFTLLRWNGSSAITLQGLTANGNGHVVHFVVVAPFAATLQNEDIGATAANRIITGTGAPVVLPATFGYGILIKDGTTARWRLLARG